MTDPCHRTHISLVDSVNIRPKPLCSVLVFAAVQGRLVVTARVAAGLGAAAGAVVCSGAGTAQGGLLAALGIEQATLVFNAGQTGLHLR